MVLFQLLQLRMDYKETFKSTVPVMHDGKMVDGNISVLTDEEQYLGSYQPDF